MVRRERETRRQHEVAMVAGRTGMLAVRTPEER